MDSGHERTILEALDKLLCKNISMCLRLTLMMVSKYSTKRVFVKESGDYWFGYLMIAIFHQKEVVLTSVKLFLKIYMHKKLRERSPFHSKLQIFSNF